MGRSIVLPFLVSITLTAVCIVLVGLSRDPAPSEDAFSYSPIHDADPSLPPVTYSRSDIHDPAVSEHTGNVPNNDHQEVTPLGRVRTSLQELVSLAKSLVTCSGIIFCFSTFFIKSVGMASEGFVFQYASEKFGWTLQKTTWLRTALASGAVSATLIGWPLATGVLSRMGILASRLDLLIIRVSLLLLTVFFTMAWLSVSGFQLALCTCYSPFQLSASISMCG